MKTHKNKTNKVINYVNDNIDELKQQLTNQINLWIEDQNYVINDIGFDTLATWTNFCYIAIGEHVLTKTGFAYMSDEKYRFVLLNKIKELISK